jgi:hypothetical protein
MSDFEVHEIGTAKEIKLSRALSHEIDALIDQFGEGIIESRILAAYKNLMQHYKSQLESEK